jgi:hypothetical protein
MGSCSDIQPTEAQSSRHLVTAAGTHGAPWVIATTSVADSEAGD